MSTESYEIRLRNETFRVSGKYASFWEKASSSKWEPFTFDVFDACLDAKTLHLDIGAWIGPTVLYAATKASRVLAFEPDPVAWECLTENVNLNPSLAPRIELRNQAIWIRAGKHTMKAEVEAGDSMSSLIKSDDHQGSTWEIDAITAGDVAKLVEGESRVFAKIDIEGGEYQLIPMLKPLLQQSNIDFFVSFHPRFAIKKVWRYPTSRRLSKEVFECFSGYYASKVGRYRFGFPWELLIYKWTGMWLLSAKDSYLFSRAPDRLSAPSVQLP